MFVNDDLSDEEKVMVLAHESGHIFCEHTASKYHEKNCIFVKDKTDVRRLTKEEFESGDYEPCKTCLP